MNGKLYLVATPIGNLEDMTFRAVRILKEVDLIAAEDTRNSIHLLQHFDIKTPMTSYHEFNKIEKGEELVGKMLAGKNIAVITDAGTPGISDPGEELVKMCYRDGIEVIAVPGPAACITAVTSSGQSCRRFAFEAFLPKDKKEHERVIEELKHETRTIIIYEAPHHLTATLQELRSALGDDRKITLCRELTKKFEEKMQLTLKEAAELYSADGAGKEPRGEYVLVIAGKSRDEVLKEQQAKFTGLSAEEHVQMYIDQGMDKKSAMKAAAKDRGISKRDIYNEIMKKNDL